MFRSRAAAFALALVAGTAYADQDKWSFFEVPHIRTGAYRPEASLMSRNALPLPAQNRENNVGYLTVRRSADGTDEASLSVEQGRQLVCAPSNCTVTVSFDGKPAIPFQGTSDKDWGAARIVLQDSKAFVANARQARKMTVSFREASNGLATYNFEAASPLSFPSKVKRLNG
jgi:hypothetical protein